MSEHESKPLPEVDLSKPPAENIVRVTFQPENKTVEFPYGSLPYEGHGQPMSFLDVAENYGIFLDHACGGVPVRDREAGNVPRGDSCMEQELCAGR